MSTTTEQIVDWLRDRAPAAELSSDSRRIAAGDVFFAYPGDEADGRRFIDDAIERGAVAIVCEAEGLTWHGPADFPVLTVAGLKACVGLVAGLWYGQAEPALFTVAVTGTNGKTSCSQWLAAALSRLTGPSAVIGTLGTGLFRRGSVDQLAETGYTTPDAILLQRRLRDLRRTGATSLAIEASSIGLDQGRLNGLPVQTALFTNFTRDHLDYHGDMATYEAAKTRLFDQPGLQHAVLNLDDAMGQRLLAQLQRSAPQLALTGYTLAAAETDTAPAGIRVLRAGDIRSSHAGTSFQLSTPDGTMLVRSRLVGHFNVSNLLGIIGVLLGQGHALRAIVDAVEALTAVPGRMQQFGGQDAPLVVIDYAHTPDALEKTLVALRQVADQRHGKLWCVFGCGGDRDPGKRPQMGLAALAADAIIVTSDNPRSEAAADIIAQILLGIASHTGSHAAPQVVEDRAAAILWAVRHAANADVILVAGKGHENYQEIRGKKLPFLDADHAALALATRATHKGTR
ncbi:UDP-N-acetylmuramoyl-L-alanyl-D-glutamate--2,6-diaminopimelate ligase [Actimicrobium sp. CCI2.3]|uniref:UDP-N-acetylmuramoyl-L-alanyl-D-glutamate--2, 6-diaminopimelate ligase n=1 Tax=Actimicrobium sp. CCI2.3 TaxID=3048616 RepID=UPI002AB396BD|nr:UDP-N-acetylmuramoyl-L-alanyl-D-glutamate--2,6-diaminopimelate ligase [Actimicrobium sp. CCI2.3]MDY7573538.1 UDP-N-acetylmuramoyl-L-alanyl-D-glutamate--2,6-diaminopimelate ligase [Actimicrobium sp. CCI2.3]MEB0022051.1 UDP-N-acetylmuramoyl-L-alanyl-D-glutamate--2,6-diaminopimelate ligase [Actimicrobium sp. CCI2.3]